MPSILVISKDIAASAAIGDLAKESGLAFKLLPSLGAAQQELSRHRFDLLLIDSHMVRSDAGLADGARHLVRTVEAGWRANPLMIAGVFNLAGKVGEHLAIRAAGIRIFAEQAAQGEIKELIVRLASGSSITDGQGGDHNAVLLVEDLESPRFIVSNFIESLGLGQVHAVESAQEALDELAENLDRYYCVVTDVSMPEISGIELARILRRREDTQNLPIIVLTSFATSDTLVDSLKAGVSGFLVKPPRKQTLQQELQKAKRIMRAGVGARLCQPEDAAELEAHLLNTIPL